ncbi:MAG: glycoside hydrolase family 65 protein, partial [Maribacter sp.]|nr:glycoside hydrolase family 65 protein [Maribacter sp.]
MNQDYIKENDWSIIEEGFDQEMVKSSESLFSIGNGAMGQRANFEEAYSGPTFQGSYIAGVYYPDKTRVGWWKNGYPEYFAKVLNAPNWIGINVMINGVALDLFACKNVENFRRELNMQEGWYQRSFKATLSNDIVIAVKATRFLSLDLDEIGAIKYEVTLINADGEIKFTPYLDSGITNEDSNWDDKFWDTTSVSSNENRAYIEAHTMKTNFETCTFMETQLYYQGKNVGKRPSETEKENWIGHEYLQSIKQGETLSLIKFGGYTVSRNHVSGELMHAANVALQKAVDFGFDALLEMQKRTWDRIWQMSDITIEGDVKAQQGIRFNIFQLNQT